jgi:DNA-binding GntR family transcriptional regulator
MMRTAAPIHSHCYNMILSLLEREVAVGERLPVQTELAVRCQASQATISRALRELKKTGLVAEDGEGLCLRRKPGAKHAQPPPSSLSRRDEVERRILAMLTAGELNPGMTFSELALARKFGVTTGTVREALLRLARLGIFTKPARRRWQFARLNEESINHLMDLRMLIEPFALKSYFRRRPREKQPFSNLLERTRQTDNFRNPAPRRTWLDWDIHRTILEASGNPFLVEHFQFAIVATQVQWHHYGDERVFSRMARIGRKRHIDLLKDIIAGNESKALGCLTVHLDEARKQLLETYSRF